MVETEKKRGIDMDIRFKVNETDYRLSSDNYQMILNKVTIVQTGKTAGAESFQLVGYYKDEFEALKAVYYTEKYDSECKTFEELKLLSEATLSRLKELSEHYKFK
jgi:hypothetical protein